MPISNAKNTTISILDNIDPKYYHPKFFQSFNKNTLKALGCVHIAQSFVGAYTQWVTLSDIFPVHIDIKVKKPLTEKSLIS